MESMWTVRDEQFFSKFLSPERGSFETIAPKTVGHSSSTLTHIGTAGARPENGLCGVFRMEKFAVR